MKTTTSSRPAGLRVGDVVEHNPPHETAVAQKGYGLLVALAKESATQKWNIWEVRFFNGDVFRIMEGYLKKIQGGLDTNERK